MTMLLVTPLVLLLEQLHSNQGRLPFVMLWSLYMATSGQAIPSAFGHLSLAGTL
jgi:hypothetical protein